MRRAEQRAAERTAAERTAAERTAAERAAESSDGERAAHSPGAMPRLPSGEVRSAEPGEAAVAARRCPSDMVDVAGEFCIDRYEAHFIEHDSGEALSPFYHPTRSRLRASFERAQTALAHPGFPLQLGRAPRVPAPPSFQLEGPFLPRAVSAGGVLPSGYSSGEVARLACENAGKRLCREEEWVRACRGEGDQSYPYGDEYEPGACNVSRESHPAALLHGDASTGHRDPRLNLMRDRDGPLLRVTGGSPRCKSRWGDDAIYDMVGNLDEWIDDPSGVFLGGFYSRQTQSGCASRIGAHPIEYFDYSLGVRCCAL